MSICPYNKSIKSTTPVTPTNNSNRKLKDERPNINIPARGTAKKPPYETRKGPASQRNFRNQRGLGQKRDQRLEKYSQGNSYVKADGSVKESSKKVSLNHLLNFKFEARESEDFSPSTRPKYNRNNKRNNSVSAFYKERFLQANCKFSVSDDGDYSIHYTDPDAPVPWDKVEQVEIQVEDEIFCPICLFPPSVPKVTKCGHVYCWSCILHYLALDDSKRHVRECPICNIVVRKNDLRSVSIHERIPLFLGAEVEMKLMFRDAGSLIPHPIFEKDDRLNPDDEKIIQTRKITTFSPDEVLEFVIEPELAKLKQKLDEELEDLEREFVNSALKECEERKQKILGNISKQFDDDGVSKAVKTGDGSDSDPNSESGLDTSDLKVSSQRERSGSGSSSKTDPVYYFYQAESNENAFLDGINAKCFLKEYGGFSKCPPVIKANLVHTESFVMTEDLRRRHKYLSHLPLSCEYKIVELDLKPPLISQKTLDEFEGRIQRRAKTRKNKERQENNSRKRAEYEERQKMRQYINDHSYTTMASALASSSGTTGSVSILVSQAATGSGPVADNPGHGSVSSTSSEYSVSPSSFPCSSSTPMSFAQMLRTGETAFPRPRPRMPQEGPSPLVNADNGLRNRNEDDDDVQDPYYMAPEYHSSFGDALSAALDGLDVSPSGVNAEAEKVTKSKGGRKQKKKKKQTLLFSTSVQMHP